MSLQQQMVTAELGDKFLYPLVRVALTVGQWYKIPTVRFMFCI